LPAVLSQWPKKTQVQQALPNLIVLTVNPRVPLKIVGLLILSLTMEDNRMNSKSKSVMVWEAEVINLKSLAKGKMFQNLKMMISMMIKRMLRKMLELKKKKLMR